MKKTMPETVFLHLTNACNLSCIHCSVNSSKPLKDELKTEEIFRFLDELRSYGIVRLYFGGGEPFLRKDILEILGYSIRSGFKVYIETNGTVLTRPMMEKIKNGNVVLNISLDGIKAETHDFIRNKKGCFSKVIETIKECVKMGINVNVWCCVSKYNIKEVVKMPDFLASLAVTTLGFSNFSPIGRGMAHKELWVQGKEWVDFCKKIESKNKELKKKISIYYEVCYLTPEEIDESRKNGDYCYAKKSLNCQISSNGNVFPCVLFLNTRHVLGNIRNKKFSDIWLNSPKWKIFENKSIDETCKKCSYFSNCNGGCRALAFAFKNDITSRDPRCEKGYIPICPLYIAPKPTYNN